MLHLYQSNRIECLAQALGAVLAHTPVSPLETQTIVVPSQVTGRWLTLRLASTFGICANVRFVLPARFLWDCFRATITDLPATTRYDPGPLTWRVFELLPTVVADPRYADVARYLRASDERQRYELAAALANTYGQYLVYRPDWIRRWETGADADDWQADLWRRLTAVDSEWHWARAQQQFIQFLRARPTAVTALPARVFMFGVAVLSPAYLEALGAFAQARELHCFLVNPCRQYWGAISAPRELAARGVVDEDSAYYEVGHPLLASFGVAARATIDALTTQAATDQQLFMPSTAGSLLARLQDDVLDLRDTAEFSAVDTRAPNDDSLLVHACHGPLREVEVLHDHLLAWFDSDPTLRPDDVVILAPAIDDYIPHLDAVFGHAPEVRRIPFRHAARGLARGNAAIETVWELFDVARGRFEARAVLDLLGRPLVRGACGFTSADLERMEQWVEQAGIRWAYDAAHRARLGLPATSANSWRAGLDRLLLGWALPGDGTALFGDCLPYADVEGTAAGVLGRLCEFIESLHGLGRALSRPRSMLDWCAFVHDASARFLEPDAWAEAGLEALRIALVELGAQAAAVPARIEFETFLLAVERTIERSRAAPVLSGAVTVADLSQLAGLPFRAVCVLGLDDGAWPRRAARSAFDRVQLRPRPGDRDSRAQDRYVFLEALLGARERLHLSYRGQDARDGTRHPPAAVVAELIDCVRKRHGSACAKAMQIEHGLQPFSTRYFGAGPWFSYAEDLARALRSGRSERRFGRRLPPARVLPERLDLDALIALFGNTAQGFLEQALGIELPRAVTELDTREPFTLTGLERWHLRDRVLTSALAGRDDAELGAALAAEGVLPHSVIGAQVFAQTRAKAHDLVAALAHAGAGTAGVSVPIVLDCAGVRIEGVLDALHPAGRIVGQVGNLKHRQRMALWIRHLCLCAAGPRGIAARSLLIAAKGRVEFGPLAADRAMAELQTWVEYYREGLREPLPLPSECAGEFARLAAVDLDRARRQALAVWRGSDQGAGVAADPYFSYCFGTEAPLGAGFENLALRLFAQFVTAKART